MDVEDDFANKTQRWEHHADELLDLAEYPEIKSVYGCSVTEVDANQVETNSEE